MGATGKPAFSTVAINLTAVMGAFVFQHLAGIKRLQLQEILGGGDERRRRDQADDLAFQDADAVARGLVFEDLSALVVKKLFLLITREALLAHRRPVAGVGDNFARGGRQDRHPVPVVLGPVRGLGLRARLLLAQQE